MATITITISDERGKPGCVMSFDMDGRPSETIDKLAFAALAAIRKASADKRGGNEIQLDSENFRAILSGAVNLVRIPPCVIYFSE